MRTYDLSPLFRTSVGFDRMSRLMDGALQLDERARSYPPYNIAKTDESAYRITLAVAGFSEEELTVEIHENRLKVSGRSEAVEEEVEYLHRGIASRSFERTFQLADHIVVVGARVENGLLHVELARELPEAMKPRVVPIQRDTSIAAAAK